MELWQTMKAAEERAQVQELSRVMFFGGFWVGAPVGALLVYVIGHLMHRL